MARRYLLDTMNGAHSLDVRATLVTIGPAFSRTKKLKVEDWTKGCNGNSEAHAA